MESLPSAGTIQGYGIKLLRSPPPSSLASRRSGSSAPAERPPSEILEALRYIVRFLPVPPLRVHRRIPSNPLIQQG